MLFSLTFIHITHPKLCKRPVDENIFRDQNVYTQ